MTRPAAAPLPPLEIWGGVECSFVRLAARVDDQLERTGHASRAADLDLFARFGLRTLRYPLLWERHSGDAGWRWADERLARLRHLGLRPILGLLHHGCGPLPGGLLDPGFADGLARFARQVAERFPWIEAYTPVNEPLTTARFSGLYGFWHPFRRDEPAFARMVLAQCRAIRAAMAAIREVNPAARLVQTEDVGKTHSPDLLAYQADWENERRWLTFDLLTGRLPRDGPMHSYLRSAGIAERELEDFAEHPCPPDVLGMNYYVTSERLLDPRLENYPPRCHGGNHRQAYADVPAVRARAEGILGCRGILRELWERYRMPVAVTETQLACTREEQLRWLRETWEAARQLRAEGADVRAVTAWALLGACDWNTLLRERNGQYESGAFDVRGAAPRPTAVAHAIAALAGGGRIHHPATHGPGWWRRRVRLEFAETSAPRTGAAVEEPGGGGEPARPLLVLQADDGLRAALDALCHLRGLRPVFAAGPAESAGAFPAGARPWAVIVNAERGPWLAGRGISPFPRVRLPAADRLAPLPTAELARGAVRLHGVSVDTRGLGRMMADGLRQAGRVASSFRWRREGSPAGPGFGELTRLFALLDAVMDLLVDAAAAPEEPGDGPCLAAAAPGIEAEPLLVP